MMGILDMAPFIGYATTVLSRLRLAIGSAVLQFLEGSLSQPTNPQGSAGWFLFYKETLENPASPAADPRSNYYLDFCVVC
jgi:hypothetical protein